MLIAQISDCHIRDHGGALARLVDTTETLRRVVDHLVGLDPAPDVILATGDLTDDGTASQYATLLDVLAPISQTGYSPFPAITTSAHCSGRPSPTSSLADVADGPLQLRGRGPPHPPRGPGQLDSRTTRRPFRRCDGNRWLNDVLAAGPDRPTLVFTHFPPFETGLRFMDDAGLLDADRLRSVIQQSPQVRLLVTGHLHRPIHTTIGSTLVSTCPSTGNQIGLDLHPGAGNRSRRTPRLPVAPLGRRTVRDPHRSWCGIPPPSGRSTWMGSWPRSSRRIEAGEPFAKD